MSTRHVSLGLESLVLAEHANITSQTGKIEESGRVCAKRVASQRLLH